MATAPRARDRAATMSPSKQCTGRAMHQTTFCLGDQPPCYATTHTQSFCGRTADGKPRIFFLKEPCYPSQHHCGLDISSAPEGVASFSTHSRDVHSLKAVTSHYVLRSLRNRNWTRSREGLAMKEVTNPPEDTAHTSLGRSDHCPAETSCRGERASGRPTPWHRHDILTGEKKAPVFPGDPRKKRLDSEICASRRWESDCTSLRLY